MEGRWEWSVHGEHPCICICTQWLSSWRISCKPHGMTEHKLENPVHSLTSHSFHCVTTSVKLGFCLKPLDSNSSNACPFTSQTLGYLLCCPAGTGCRIQWCDPPTHTPTPLKEKHPRVMPCALLEKLNSKWSFWLEETFLSNLPGNFQSVQFFSKWISKEMAFQWIHWKMLPVIKCFPLRNS